ncbi:adenylyl-sulfate kinase [Saccharopolyspora hirsuta]|uniref:Adenylyl-sulfate kinase n=1 Tax=Saccharopolyspora hirsuta TaxID=1837 RepID=A0A5M7C3R5_SACHI|nr:adenylyl-sulfate kinase [Saccharopolyspora hirsuta]KAA5834918.1 adenylyl-sulfate kinase [Saccharopolyspora hirsuta]
MASTTDLLRFITCGSVDDGKSTLIGRLLHESGALPTDQLAALTADSERHGTRGPELDFALLVDGLAAEREQGITIDVAHRYFATGRRRFIVADTPGHEQYTRNMVTGASTSDAAVILLDARKGLLTQTRRHTNLVALLGIRHVALAVNKLDLLDYSQDVFDEISAEYRAFAAGLDLTDVTCVPVSAVEGTNVVARSSRTPWYRGPALLEWLESVEVGDGADAGPARLLVQWVNRPTEAFRGFSGRVLRGTLRRGDRVRVVPGGQESAVERIVTMDGDLPEAVRGRSVTAVLADEVDVSRGSVLAAETPAEAADSFRAHLVWLDEQELRPGAPYLAKFGASTVGITVDRPHHLIDVNTQAHQPATTVRCNEICSADVHLDRPVPYEPYRVNRDLGSFILVDRVSNRTVGAGLVDRALDRSADVRWQAVTVDKAARSARNGHRPCAVWFTGLSGAGKSTVADLVERELHRLGAHTFLLDGDNVRHGLNGDLGFTAADRVENVRRIAEVAALMVDAGLIVLVSAISPFRAERALARSLVEPGEFCEVHVDVPLAVAERRDPKGLYAKARQGELPDFTGIDSPYEPPREPELRLDTSTSSAEKSAGAVLAKLRAMGVIES